jgi:hypothetical protein
MKQKWLVLEGDDGWQIVIPETDTKPHSTDNSNKVKKELSYIDCPCFPKIDYLNKIIIHNSFKDTIIIEESVNKITK